MYISYQKNLDSCLVICIKNKVIFQIFYLILIYIIYYIAFLINYLVQLMIDTNSGFKDAPPIINLVLK